MPLPVPERNPQPSRPEPKKIVPPPEKTIFEQKREWRTKELKYKVGNESFSPRTPEARLLPRQRREKFGETFKEYGSHLNKRELIKELRELRGIEEGRTHVSDEERREAKRLREHYQKQFGIKSKYSY